MRLLRTPEPFADESLMGYVLRLTDENGYDATSWIFDLAGLKVTANCWSVLYRPAFDSTELEQVLGLTRSEFDALRYGNVTFGRTVTFSSQSLPAEFIRFSAPKVCPACLREANYYRHFWDLLPLTACPAHGVMLIDSCPDCGRRISWSRKKVSICRCGFDWRTSQAVEADPSRLTVSKQALSLCSASEEIPVAKAVKNPLYQLSLEDFCRALTLVAGYYLFVRSGRWVTTKTPSYTCHEAYSRAFDAFVDWPSSFYELLKLTSHSEGRTIGDSRLYHQIEKQCDTPSLQFIIIACEDYLESQGWNWSGIGLTPPLRFRRFIDKDEACRRLGVTRRWLDILITQGKLLIIRQPGRSDILIDAFSITRLREKLADLPSLLDVALTLDVEMEDAKDLIRQGCLKPLSGPTVDGLAVWRFDPGEIVNLIGRIEGMVTRKQTAPANSLISSGVAIHQMKIRGFGAGHFVRAVLEGEIVPQVKLPRHRGLRRFAFPKNCVRKYVQVNAPAGSRCIARFRVTAKLLARMREENDKVFVSNKREVHTSNVCDLIDITRYMKTLETIC